MKYVLINLAFLCLFFSCEAPDPKQNTPEQPKANPNSCKCEIQKLSERSIHKWFNVNNFDTKNPDCYKLLREYASSNSKDQSQVTFHFFDNLPEFTPPSNGYNYGGQEIMDQEILLFNKIGGQEFFLFDNWETGKYKEPK